MSFTKIVSVSLITILGITACGQQKAKKVGPRAAKDALAFGQQKQQVPPLPPDDEGQPRPGGEISDVRARPKTKVTIDQEHRSEDFVVKEKNTETDPSPITDITVTRSTTRRVERRVQPRDTSQPNQLRPQPVANPEEEKAKQCSVNFLTKDRNWNPGLPYEPFKEPRLTYGAEVIEGKSAGKNKKAPKKNTVYYTDAAADGLLNVAFEKFARLPPSLQPGSKELSIRLDDIKVSLDPQEGAVKLQFGYEIQQGIFIPILLRGQLQREKNSMSAITQMQQVLIKGQKPHFSAELICADVDLGCQNIMIRLRQHSRTDRIIRVAYIIHRWGSVHVSLSQRDKKVSKKITNLAHKQMALFLANTAHNSCLNLLGDVSQSGRKLPVCAHERKLRECVGKSPRQQAAASDYSLRTWSVAFGRSGFEWLATTKPRLALADFASNTKDDLALSVSGRLVVSEARPVWPLALAINKNGKYAQLIRDARLVMNDGAGNINLQLAFIGTPKSHTRLNLTSLFEDPSLRDQIASQVQNMPEISGQDLAQKEEPGDADIAHGQ